jgi:hypothetical protein
MAEELAITLSHGWRRVVGNDVEARENTLLTRVGLAAARDGCRKNGRTMEFGSTNRQSGRRQAETFIMYLCCCGGGSFAVSRYHCICCASFKHKEETAAAVWTTRFAKAALRFAASAELT